MPVIVAADGASHDGHGGKSMAQGPVSPQLLEVSVQVWLGARKRVGGLFLPPGPPVRLRGEVGSVKAFLRGGQGGHSQIPDTDGVGVSR